MRDQIYFYKYENEVFKHGLLQISLPLILTSTRAQQYIGDTTGGGLLVFISGRIQVVCAFGDFQEISVYYF